MRVLKWLAIGLCALMAWAGAPAQAASLQFRAALNGAQVPTASSQTGLGVVSYETNGRTLSWTITFSGVTGGFTAAHFHGPAPAGTDAAAVVTIAGTTSPLIGKAALTAEQEAQLLAGQWYVNIHSGTYPNGEIRGQVLPVRGDFNANGTADILWRHTATGDNYLWLMDGLTQSSGGFLRSVPDSNWVVAGIGDLNGDGRTDVLWRNNSTGQTYGWLMFGTSILGEGLIRQVPSANWQVAGVADFNGDGKADVLWRNSATGDTYLWLMNGVTITGEGPVRQVGDTNWQIAGVGDLNGDGKADIIWRHRVSGHTYGWLVNGAAITGEGFIRQIPDLNWVFQGVTDFSGEGKADIVWRHSATGQIYVWQMNGLSISGEGFLPTVADQNWKMVSFADLNGDGKADIVWRNATPASPQFGQDYLWMMNGLGIASQGFLPSVPDANWQVQPQPDTVPDPLNFTSQTGVALSTVVTSNTITVTGINAAAPISVGGGSYSINGGAYTTAAGTVNNGDTVTARVTSSASYSTQTCATVTIGGVFGHFCVTTQAAPADTTPNAFSFTSQTGVALSTVVTSNTITPTGYNAAAPISVSGGSYSINGGSFVTSAGTISPGQTVAVRLTSSSSYGTQTCATLTIGGVSGQFCATTLAQTTVTLYPSADNLLLINSLNSATANTVYQTGELAVGCNWAYSSLTGIQDFVCAVSLVKFNLTTLAGRTIDSATLTLTTNYAGVGYYPRTWRIRALSTTWSPSTVTWNNFAGSYSYYIASNINQSPPTYAGQIYNINFAATVQAWANGTYANNGLIFESSDYTFPYDISYDAFAFYSVEAGGTWRPALTVTYH